MSISSLGPPRPGASPAPQKLGADTPDARAAQTERDANRRIARAEETVRQSQRELEKQSERIRDDYERQYVSQSYRNEESLENERRKGYEAIKELKKNQADLLRQIRKEGERDKQQAETYYRNTIRTTDQRGQEALDSMQLQNERRQRYEQKTGEMAIDKIKTESSIQSHNAKNDGERELASIQNTFKGEVDQLRANSNAAREHAEEVYSERFQESLEKGQERIDNVMNEASRQLNRIRADTAAHLSAYASRQSDPFYKLMDLGARMSDQGDAYVVRVAIPEHERKHVSVSVRGDSVVISGFRQNTEKLDTKDGRIKTSAGFQAYSETLPLTFPVDPKEVTKEFQGGTMVVTLPKKPEWTRRPQHQKNIEEKPRVSRPQFPENLGKVMAEPQPDPAEKPKNAPRTKSTKTLRA